jgi:alpha-tubulin suppressor-like RCC1 family protein
MNYNGRLGLGNTTNYNSPKQVGALTTWAQLRNGHTGYNNMAIKTDGTMWSWGRNTQGQLGVGDTINKSSPVKIGYLTNWLRIASSGYSTLAKSSQ